MIDYDIRDILMRKGPFDPKAAMDAVNAVLNASVRCVDGEKLLESGGFSDRAKALNDFDAAWDAMKAAVALMREVWQ